MFLNKQLYRINYSFKQVSLNLHPNKINKYLYTGGTDSSKNCNELKKNIAYNPNSENSFGITINKHNLYDDKYHEELDITFFKEWSKNIPQSLFQTMRLLKIYCMKNRICISDNRFDNFIDSLTDNIRDATDHEIKIIFESLSTFKTKQNEKNISRLRNYIEVWVALDDECFNRKLTMTINDKLLYISLFYKLGVLNNNGFCNLCLSNFLKNMKNLEKHQFLKIVFYIGMLKKFHNKKSVHNVEAYLVDHFTEFQIDELAIIAKALYGINIPIRCPNLVNSITEKIIETSNDIQETSLLQLLKLINISVKPSNYDKIYQLSDCLKHQLSRLNMTCNIYLALVLASARRVNESCLSNIAENTMKCMSNVSLNNLERLVRALGTLNFIPSTKPCFFSKIVEELRKDSRKGEIFKNGKYFASCVFHLGLSDIYPQDIMKEALNKEFLENVYGKSCYLYSRDILRIHNTAKIFYKDINISNLLDSEVEILSKRNTNYVPDEQKITQSKTNKLFLDIKKTLQDVRGGGEYVISDHILTHYENGDIIICNNHEGVPQAVDKAFEDQPFGTIRNPPDGNIWISLIIGQNRIRTSEIENIPKPSGFNITKKKELNKIGYHSEIICLDEYKKCQNQLEKIQYLTTFINKAIKYKNK